MIEVGLTGGIASGKSHVLRRLAEAGLLTLDLDRVSRDVMAPGGAAYADVLQAFGPAVVAADGTIDRAGLGARVFADPVARRRLESLVHPRIREAEARYLSSARGQALAVVDAALLVESGQHLRFARLVVVYCAPGEQLRRLIERDGLDAAAARARIDAQMPAAEKRRFAHFVIDNSGTLADTDAQVESVVAALSALAAEPAAPLAIGAERAAAAVGAGPQRGPRGLRPWAVVEELAARGDLDMARMAALADPAHEGRWYEATAAPAGDAPPEAMALPVALFAGARRPGDAPFAIAAAATMARLTHREPVALSGAVLAVLAALHVLTADSTAMRDRIRGWSDAASAWTGAAPPPSTVATVRAAAAHGGAGDAAAGEAAAGGGMADLARALAGGAPAAPVAAERTAQVARILAGSRR
jgi:dephospho-CoA kinase